MVSHLAATARFWSLFATAAMSDLQIHRVNGNERFVIGSARCLTVGSGDDLMLWFEIETVADSAQPCSDTADNPTLRTLNWEFSSQILTSTISSCMSLFYYNEHQYLRNNHVTVLSRSGDRTFRIRWKARTQAVNIFDGSKPDAQVESTNGSTNMSFCRLGMPVELYCIPTIISVGVSRLGYRMGSQAIDSATRLPIEGLRLKIPDVVLPKRFAKAS